MRYGRNYLQEALLYYAFPSDMSLMYHLICANRQLVGDFLTAFTAVSRSVKIKLGLSKELMSLPSVVHAFELRGSRDSESPIYKEILAAAAHL